MDFGLTGEHNVNIASAAVGRRLEPSQ